MSFSEAQIIYSARARTGLDLTNAVGSEYISDTALKAEFRENIRECCKAFGASTSTKEVDFVTTAAPVVPPPAAPTPVVLGTGGTLLPATYSYAITSLYGTRESMLGAVAQPVVASGSTSSIALTWAAVPNATAYKVYGRTAGVERLLAKVTTGTTWTDTGAARPSSGPPIRDTTGQQMQEYEVSLFLGDDILEITDLLRSGAYRTEAALDPSYFIDPVTGVPLQRGGFIDQGLQQNAFEVIVAQERYRELQKYSWELVNIDSVRYLRMMPPPRQNEVVRCTYVSVANSIQSLPDEARDAMENAACRAILDCVLNRIKAEPSALQEGPLERRAFIESCAKQRDRYHDRYLTCLSRAR